MAYYIFSYREKWEDILPLFSFTCWHTTLFNAENPSKLCLLAFPLSVHFLSYAVTADEALRSVIIYQGKSLIPLSHSNMNQNFCINKHSLCFSKRWHLVYRHKSEKIVLSPNKFNCNLRCEDRNIHGARNKKNDLKCTNRSLLSFSETMQHF